MLYTMDKVQKIREEIKLVVNRRLNLLNGDYFNLIKETDGCTNEIMDIIDSLKEEPVSERFAFKAIPRLLEMIEPTDRAKAYIAKLADALEVEGYHTDAKIVRENLKIMNGEKVPMATMDEEPVSEGLKTELNKYIKDHFTIDTEQLDRFGIEEKDYMYSMDKSDMLALVEYFTNWKKEKDESITKELSDYINELSKQFPEVSFAKLSRIAVRVAKWQKEQDQSTIELAEDHAMLAGMEQMKEQMMEKAIDGEVLENYDGKVLKYDDSILDEKLSNFKVFDKVKIIVIKED